MILRVCLECEHLKPSADGYSTQGFCKKEQCYCELTKCIIEKALQEYINNHAIPVAL